VNAQSGTAGQRHVKLSESLGRRPTVLKSNAKFSVILASTRSRPYGALLSHFSSTIVLEDDRKLLHFWCTEVAG
jgi:hypothetical protein